MKQLSTYKTTIGTCILLSEFYGALKNDNSGHYSHFAAATINDNPLAVENTNFIIKNPTEARKEYLINLEFAFRIAVEKKHANLQRKIIHLFFETEQPEKIKAKILELFNNVVTPELLKKKRYKRPNHAKSKKPQI